MREQTYVFLAVLLIVALGFGVYFGGDRTKQSVSGAALASAPSSVTVQGIIAVTLSANLGDGIAFGNIASLPAADIAATNNADGAGSISTMYVNIIASTNTLVDICIKGSGDMASGGNTIPLAGYTYGTSLLGNGNPAGPVGSVSLTTSYAVPPNYNAIPDTVADQLAYFRYWLDIPSATQAAGTYTNSVEFSIVQDGLPCGT